MSQVSKSTHTDTLSRTLTLTLTRKTTHTSIHTHVTNPSKQTLSHTQRALADLAVLFEFLLAPHLAIHAALIGLAESELIGAIEVRIVALQHR